jgi:hypothetical protein
VRVKAEENCRENNAKEVRFESTDKSAEATAGNGRHRKEQGGEERGERSGLQVGIRKVLNRELPRETSGYFTLLRSSSVD